MLLICKRFSFHLDNFTVINLSFFLFFLVEERGGRSALIWTLVLVGSARAAAEGKATAEKGTNNDDAA